MAETEARRLAYGPHLPVGCAGHHGFLPALLWLATMASIARAMCRLRLLAQDVGQGRGCTSSMVKFQASIWGNLQNPMVFRISFSLMKSAIFGVRIWYFHPSRPIKPHHFCKNRRNQSLWNPMSSYINIYICTHTPTINSILKSPWISSPCQAAPGRRFISSGAGGSEAGNGSTWIYLDPFKFLLLPSSNPFFVCCTGWGPPVMFVGW